MTEKRRNLHTVKAPATDVSSEAVGVQGKGRWQVTIQARLKDGSCSEPALPCRLRLSIYGLNNRWAGTCEEGDWKLHDDQN